jgi:acetolactate synthase-1/3 small subunit
MENERVHAIAALVEHKPGVLHNISNLFRRRGFNIESISVGPTEQKDLARMTITVKGDEKTVEQVVKQLSKLVDVIKVSRLDPASIVTREMALIKVNVSDTKTRSDIINCVDVFRGHVVDVSPENLMIEITGGPDKIDAFLNLMKAFGIIEVARTGVTALSRGSKSLKIED